MPAIKLLEAVYSDIPGLIALLEDLFGIEKDFQFNPALQQQGLEMLLDSKKARVMVAKAEGTILGMVTGQLTVSTSEGGYSLLVEDLIVKETHRGKGIGRSLLQEIGAWAKSREATRIQLLADRDNDSALLFYKNLGWQTTNLICLTRTDQNF